MKNNYNYSLYQVLLGSLIRKGKKTKAKMILDAAFKSVFYKTKILPRKILKLLTVKLGSIIDVKTLKIRKNTHMVPFAIKMKRSDYLLAKNLINSVKEDTTHRSITEKLSEELFSIIKNKPCKSLTKHKEMLKQATMHRSNLHFRW